MQTALNGPAIAFYPGVKGPFTISGEVVAVQSWQGILEEERINSNRKFVGVTGAICSALGFPHSERSGQS